MSIESDRLDKLIAALRTHPLPGEMKWDYTRTGGDGEDEGCGTVGCALLLAALLWPEHRDMLINEGDDDELGAFFGLSAEQARDAFYLCAMDIAMKDVTPGLVACALQKMKDDNAKGPGAL